MGEWTSSKKNAKHQTPHHVVYTCFPISRNVILQHYIFKRSTRTINKLRWFSFSNSCCVLLCRADFLCVDIHKIIAQTQIAHATTDMISQHLSSSSRLSCPIRLDDDDDRLQFFTQVLSFIELLHSRKIIGLDTLAASLSLSFPFNIITLCCFFWILMPIWFDILCARDLVYDRFRCC